MGRLNWTELMVLQTRVSCIAGKFFTIWAIGKSPRERELWFLEGFPSGSMVKNPPAKAWDAGDVGLTPGSGRSPEGGNGIPLQFSCREKPGQGSLEGYSTWGRKELDMTENSMAWFLEDYPSSSHRLRNLRRKQQRWPQALTLRVGNLQNKIWTSRDSLNTLAFQTSSRPFSTSTAHWSVEATTLSQPKQDESPCLSVWCSSTIFWRVCWIPQVLYSLGPCCWPKACGQKLWEES